MSNLVIAQFPRRVKVSAQHYQRVADVSLAKRQDTFIFGGKRHSMLDSGHIDQIEEADGQSNGTRSSNNWSLGGGRRAHNNHHNHKQESVIVTITEENVSVWNASDADPVTTGGKHSDHGAPSFGQSAPSLENIEEGKFVGALGSGNDFDTVGQQESSDLKNSSDVAEIDMELLVRRTLGELYDQGMLLGRPTVTQLTSNNGYGTTMAAVSQELVHLVVLKLEEVGVGSEVGTLSVMPTTMVRSSAIKKKDQVAFSKRLFMKLTDQSMLDAMSQIRIEKLLEDVRAGTTWSFDYACFLVCASMIAAMGLLSNSVVSIIAAMLVSPIMGPIVALTFGANVRDWSLARTGLQLELVSLFGCLLVGFIVMTIAMPFLGSNLDFPTAEMKARTAYPNLVVGVFVALPSGAGVALSLMSDNMASLVGVAISASLLPPAVNCGMFFSLALFGNELLRHHDFTSKDLVHDGAVSLLLTIENIICVFLAAYVTFWVKQVTPITRQRSLWHQDLVRTRKMNAERRNSTVDEEAAKRTPLKAQPSLRLWS